MAEVAMAMDAKAVVAMDGGSNGGGDSGGDRGGATRMAVSTMEVRAGGSGRRSGATARCVRRGGWQV